MKRLSKYYFFAFLFLLFSLNTLAQTKDELERKRKQKEKEIAYTKKLLTETSEKQKKTLNYLNTLNAQIGNREELISTIRKEIKYIDEQIVDNNDIISALEKDLEHLKKEYASMVRFAYKNRNTYSKIGFILSAKTFNQSFKRLRLLQNYSEYRKKQMELIFDTKESIEKKVTELTEQKQEKTALLKKQNNEKLNLEKDKSQKSNLVSNLKKRKDQLEKELKKKEKIAAELNRKIQEIIEAEMARKKNAYYLTPEAKKLSLDFANNRAKLPWPVSRGFISENYGKHKHPTLKNVYTVNNGVKIKTSKGSKAQAVFSGEVKNIISIPGAGKSVLINHGEYFTVYSNLTDITVKVGDKVDVKDEIGTVRYNPKNGSTEMELQIWKLKQHLNPVYWLAPL